MSDQPQDPSRPAFIPVCAIGASAGGVGVLQTLFRLLPVDLGLAYVVVVHLAPDHPSAMHEILAACTRMPVIPVLDGLRLAADSVYVIPPDRELVIEGDDIRARPFTDAPGRRAPIDMFFRSVASGRGDGMAVVLTGAGADGALGVRAVKEAGGLVLVQEPGEADFPSMPRNAIATGVADVVAPVGRLAERIAEAARSKEAVRSLDMDGAANDLRRIVGFLRSRTGHDFSGYKRSTVLRRVARRMQIVQADTLDGYARHLRATPEEAKALFADLLISVTVFFRDPEAFAALGRDVIAPLVEKAADPDGDGEIRAWVVGCATGEEAYSLAILLLEEAERLKVHVPMQIFATDLDEGALATAREGRYPRAIEADVSPERLKRYFVDEGTHYRIGRAARDLVLFATHSVMREPPFMRLDLVTCRNVLIYLERALQQHVCAIFHYGLKPGRYLFLGTAETADTAQGSFIAVDRDARIYASRPTDRVAIPLLAPPFPPVPSRVPAAGSVLASYGAEAGDALAAAHASALEASAPPSALVGADGAVVHLSPTAGRFILLSAGPLSGRLSSIVRPELRLDVRLALDRAFDTGQPSATRTLDVRFEGEVRRVSAHVAPVPAGEGSAPRAMVYFHDDGPAQADLSSEVLPPLDEVQHLHAELKAAQEAALAGRIGHDAAMQELRASNEELQSLNEEYRSTAEELETSKEELQSINEELQTVNAELKAKLAAISAAHDDLQNLTASSEIGTLFLDTELRIRMFTPRVAALVNVAHSDIGRPITDFTHRLAYDGLRRDVERVLGDLQPIEAEIRGLDGRWFMLRVRPYRTGDNRVEGAVVTFDDITERKRVDTALRASEARFRAFVEASSDAVYRMSADWAEMLRLEGSAFIPDTLSPSNVWLDEYIEPDEQARVRAAIDSAIRRRAPFELEHRVRGRDGRTAWTYSRAVPIFDADGRVTEWLGTASDVTARHEAEEALRISEQRSRTLFEAMDQGFYFAEAVFDADGRCVDLFYLDENPAAVAIVGRSAKGQRMSEVAPYEQHWRDTFGAVARTGLAQRLERYAAPDRKWYAFHAFKPDHAGPNELAIVFRDATARRETEAALREHEQRFRTLAQLVPSLLWQADPRGQVVVVNQQWCDYTGQSLYGAQDGGLLGTVHPDDLAAATRLFAEAYAAGTALEAQYRIRRGDGLYRWFLVRHVPARDAEGQIERWYGAATDVQDLHDMEQRQAVLVAELQHRTRNLIAVVRGVADDTMDETGPTEAFRAAFGDRLSALSRVQGLLSRAESEPIAIGALVGLELDALGAGAAGGRVTAAGPDVFLWPSTVQTLALALHELATNARKHGALSHEGGRLAVTWAERVEGGEHRLTLDWEETGLERAPDRTTPPGGGGYGRELIENALPHATGARTTYALTSSGVRCRIDIAARPGRDEA